MHRIFFPVVKGRVAFDGAPEQRACRGRVGRSEPNRGRFACENPDVRRVIVSRLKSKPESQEGEENLKPKSLVQITCMFYEPND